jgi:hypothetical protein
MLRALLILMLWLPGVVLAKEIHVQVSYVIQSERLSPSPQMTHGHYSQSFVLHENGTVERRGHSNGRFGGDKFTTTRLGSELKVVDQNSLTRTWSVGAQRRTLLITVNDNSCNATISISGPSEFNGFSTELGQPARYRNASVESIRCNIE